MQTSSALDPGRIGVSRATQRVAVGACADWFRAAHDQHTKEYRGGLPSDVEARFGGDHTVASSTFKLPAWTSSFRRPMPELQSSLAQHWDAHMYPWIQSLRYDWRRAAILPSIIAAVILIILIAAGAVVAGFVIALLVGGIWALVIRSRHEKTKIAVAQAQAILADAKKQSLHVGLRARRGRRLAARVPDGRPTGRPDPHPDRLVPRHARIGDVAVRAPDRQRRRMEMMVEIPEPSHEERRRQEPVGSPTGRAPGACDPTPAANGRRSAGLGAPASGGDHCPSASPGLRPR